MDVTRPHTGFELDECHLTGPFGGILLTTIKTNPNDGMYLITWAQGEAENTNKWDWFLETLISDLKIDNDGGQTLISNRLKVHLYYYMV